MSFQNVGSANAVGNGGETSKNRTTHQSQSKTDAANSIAISKDLIKEVAKNLNNLEPKSDARDFFKNKVIYNHQGGVSPTLPNEKKAMETSTSRKVSQ